MAKKVKKPTAPTKNPTITAKMDKEALKATLRSARWENKELEEQLRQLREAHDNLKIQLASSEKEKTDLSILCRQSTIKIEIDERDIQTYRRTIDELKNELETCQENSRKIIEDLKIKNNTLGEAKLRLIGAREVLMEMIEEHVDFS
jgi:chromosome segregation ATPase